MSDSSETGAQDDTVTEHGERYGYSRLTDTWYRVTAWVDHGDGQIQARSKEPVEREEVPEEVREQTMERVQR